MSAWQAIVFDLDDTLYPERSYVLSGYRAVAAWSAERLEISAAAIYTELEQLFLAGVRRNTFNTWLSGREIAADELVSQLVEVYRAHEPVLLPFSEVPELLEWLHQRYRLGLVSDGYLAVQQRKWAALQLAHHFDAVVFSDYWGREAWKPSTKPFETVLELLQAEPASAVYIADNPTKDFYGARKVGMATIWLRHSQGDYCRLDPPDPDYAADLVVESWSQLSELLDRLME